MGWFKSGATGASAAAKADAKSDKEAGGFGSGRRVSRGEMSDEETEAYDRAYTESTPRSWRS